MPASKLHWSPDAVAELEALVSFWEEATPRTGARLLSELEICLDLVSDLPGIGRPLPHLPRQFRQILADVLRIVYEIKEDAHVLIHSVRDAREDDRELSRIIQRLTSSEESDPHA